MGIGFFDVFSIKTLIAIILESFGNSTLILFLGTFLSLIAYTASIPNQGLFSGKTTRMMIFSVLGEFFSMMLMLYLIPIISFVFIYWTIVLFPICYRKV